MYAWRQMFLSNHLQLAVILRYIAAKKSAERFWNFISSTGRNAVKQIDPLFSDSPEKLIAESCDGASAMSGLQKLIIKKKNSGAHYIHCYSHKTYQVSLIQSSAATVK